MTKKRFSYLIIPGKSSADSTITHIYILSCISIVTLHAWRLTWSCILRSGGCSRAVLIILYPRYSRALYLDPSKKIQKKDYTHIKYVLDRAMLGFSMRGGYIQHKKTNKAGLCFTHKTDFCCIQQPAWSENNGFYVIHRMTEYRRDVQSLCMNLHPIPISRDGPKPLEPCRIINFEMISTGSNRKLRPSSSKMSSKRMGCSMPAQYRELTSEPALPYSVRTWRLSLSLGLSSRIWTDGKSALLKNNVSV